MFLLFYISFAIAKDIRKQLPESISISRRLNTDWVEFKVTCSQGVAQDKKTYCTLTKKVAGELIVTMPYPYDALHVMVEDFFKTIPKSTAEFRDVETSDQYKWDIRKKKEVARGVAGNHHSSVRPDWNPKRAEAREKLSALVGILESYLLVNSSAK